MGTTIDNPRQQINQITTYIDGSMVYGSDDVRAAELRSFDNGLLRVSDHNLLIFNDAGLPNANAGPNDLLFLAGDVRANENAALTSMHTLWVREQNRIAAEIVVSNSSLSDEQIYQQSRQLVIREIQAIIYDQFLPVLLGSEPYRLMRVAIRAWIPRSPLCFSTSGYRFGYRMLSV